jgi:hypothetical protein
MQPEEVVAKPVLVDLLKKAAPYGQAADGVFARQVRK